MTIIYSGFDTIIFAVQGALSPEVINRMEQVKVSAENERREVPFHVEGLDVPVSLSPNGRTGGYTYVVSTGQLGQNIAFKKNLSRTQYNAQVKIRSLSLATLGWRGAVEEAFRTLGALEFHVEKISFNRVDYCMDFLNTPMTLDPREFVAHSRVKKDSRSSHNARGNADLPTCKVSLDKEPHVKATMRSDVFESITIGKMPGRQVIVYDKRREALDKRTFAWFKIWGLDRRDPMQQVHRIELRAGKNELMKYNVRTFEDFEDRIGDVFVKAARVVRMMDPQSIDTNISRRSTHSTWEHVQTHVAEQLFSHVSNVMPNQILDVIREGKAREHLAQIRGNIAGYAVCLDIAFEDIPSKIPELLRGELEVAINDPSHPFRKTHVRARDRLRFT